MPTASRDDDDRTTDPRIVLRPQYTVAVLATLTNFSTGAYIAWTAVGPPIPNQNGGQASEQAVSWICSSVALGAVAGSLPAGTIADRIGRKRSILISSLLLSLCWIFLARLVAGVGCGASSILVPLYLSEIMEDTVKECLGTIYQFQIALGILFTYVIGFSNNWTAIALLCALAPAVLSIATQSIPESPMWLIRQRRQTVAEGIVSHSRGKCLTFELKKHRKASIIAFGTMVFQQLSGMNTLVSYATWIFQHIRIPLSSTTCSVITGSMYLIATMFSKHLIDRIGRKLLLFLSLSIMSVSMFVLSGYFRLQKEQDVSRFTWLPFLSLVAFVVAFGVGCGPIPWILIDRIFPDDVKTTAIAACTVCNWTLAFVAMKYFQDMVSFMGISSTFAAYGMVSLLGTAFVAIFVPETEGKSDWLLYLEARRIHHIMDECSKTQVFRLKTVSLNSNV
ncbi:PREDICTED: facilitated trehalose transporter Tret1-like [Dufourea novaeangliae]|uniref:facilitated trehalose transporter Tret1-like n=1 Tax=Dufourea novaeangliae TaxID=178035 RepID=UPI000767C1CE|nr:PREDICTED: facilitated trehalose transporter Tret1-like [Dufourea novaeangliae]